MAYTIIMSHESDPHSWNDLNEGQTLAECREHFTEHVSLIARYADETGAYGYVYVGVGDERAECPDWKLSVGKRGGIKYEKV